MPPRHCHNALVFWVKHDLGWGGKGRSFMVSSD